MKISTKISLFIIGAGIITMFGVGYFGFLLTRLLLERTVSNNQIQLARQTLDRVDQRIYNQWYDVLSLSQDPSLKIFMSGSQLPSTPITFELEKLKNIHTSWEQLLVVDTKGKTRVSMQTEEQSSPDTITAYPELLSALQESLKGTHYYSDVQRSSRTQQYVLTFAAPIYGTGQDISIQGAVIGQISWNDVLIPLDTIPAIIRIFNNRREFLGGNHQENPENIMQQDPRVTPLLQSLPQKKELSIISEGTQEEAQTLLSSVEEKGYLDYRGNGWILTIETPTQIVFAPAIKNIFTLLLIIIPLILLMGAFLFLLLRMFIVYPIQRFQKGLDIISSGNLDYHLDIIANDELGRLADAFNRMVGQLKEMRARLEQQVFLRTEELSKKISMLQEAERALINVMDDLEKEKKSVVQERAHYKALLESIGDGVVALDMNGRITYFNQNAAALIGQEPQFMLNAHFSDVFRITDEQGKNIPLKDFPLSKIFSEGKQIATSFTPAFYFERKNKTRFPVAITASPILIGATISGVISVFRDITLLKEIDRAKSEFVSLASHQLRTPIATINWYTELLLDSNSIKTLTLEQKDFLNEIYTAAKRMVGLIDALLNVSRLELGTLPIKKMLTDIALLTDDIIHELAHAIKKKKIIVKKEYKDHILPISTDPDLIRIVLENLISNAIDYNHEKGSLIITIKKEKSNLHMAITDTGYGIPKYQQDQIFQKMFRADNIRVIDPNGNGLGLYMTKSIIEKLGGKIWFESEEDKGTTFFFTLPLIEKGES